jgi:hypothetical protein
MLYRKSPLNIFCLFWYWALVTSLDSITKLFIPTLSGVLCEQSRLGKNLILTSFGRKVFIFPADLNLSKLSFYILFPFSPLLTLVSPLLTLVSPLLTLVEEGSPLLRSDPRPASCCPPP